MSVIIPAILPTSHEDLLDKLSRLHGITNAVQIDVVDGRFAKPACWPYTEGATLAHALLDGLPHLDEMQYEMDLMVAEPGEGIGMWINAGATRITLHAESTPQLPKVIKEIEVKFGHDKNFAPDLLSIGLALNVNTELSLIEPFFAHIDYVQFMGIRHIGRQGQPFDQGALTKVRALRKLHPKIPIQVDGGVSIHTAPDLLRAGVDRLIIGSDLWKAPDLREEFAKLEALAQEYGIYE